MIYETQQAAQRAIKDYNMAQLDDRVMTVEYAIKKAPVSVPANNNAHKKGGLGPRKVAPLSRRAGGIRKRARPSGESKKGKTLNLSGSSNAARR